MQIAVMNQKIPQNNPPGYTLSPRCDRCANCKERMDMLGYSKHICKEFKIEVSYDGICREFTPRSKISTIESAEELVKRMKGVE